MNYLKGASLCLNTSLVLWVGNKITDLVETCVTSEMSWWFGYSPGCLQGGW